jgi:hypothetical protein
VRRSCEVLGSCDDVLGEGVEPVRWNLEAPHQDSTSRFRIRHRPALDKSLWLAQSDQDPTVHRVAFGTERCFQVDQRAYCKLSLLGRRRAQHNARHI